MQERLTDIAERAATWAGRPVAFVAAITLVIVWAVSGPLFGFSEVWQLLINTTTTVITFVMVFVVQNTQNRDSLAMEAKLDELLRAVAEARTDLVGVEHKPDTVIESERRRIEDEVSSF